MEEVKNVESSTKKDKKLVKKMTMAAMFAALAYVLALVAHFLHLSIIPAAPFLTYDPKDIIICIGGFVLGPLYALGISVVVSLIEMITVSSTGFYGFIMNVISTCALVIPAAFIYRSQKSFKGALLALIVGFVSEIIVMTLWNIIITPIYTGMDRKVLIQKMLSAIVLFNAMKVGLNISLVLLLYKPITRGLRATGLLEKSKYSGNKNTTLAMLLIGGILFIVLALIWILLKVNA